MKTIMNRRELLPVFVLAPILGGAPGRALGESPQTHAAPPNRLFFVSQGRTAMMNADGTGLRVFDFKEPNQATWQPCGCFPDGNRVLFLSMEPRRDGPGRPFEEYYTKTPTHIWVYDLKRDSLTEIATRDRMAVFYTPALLLSDDRMLVQVVRNKVGQIFSMNLDGSDAQEFTRASDGFPYGLSLSPDGKRVAFHLSCEGGYQVWTSDVNGSKRVKVAAAPGHIYFGTSWSPDGRWILYVDCLPDQDPGHDWADVCIGRADGTEHRVLTRGQAMWFGATYGGAKTRGGGSNVPAWTHDGRILYPRRLSGSKVAWEFQPQRPDVDHFNRDYKPELARGGTEICLLDPRDGSERALTHSEPAVWDFRASESPDGRHIVFCRAETGGVPAIWVMDSDGRNPRMLTKGLGNAGADHPRWLPTRPK
jgi:hypothetical protein